MAHYKEALINDILAYRNDNYGNIECLHDLLNGELTRLPEQIDSLVAELVEIEMEACRGGDQMELGDRAGSIMRTCDDLIAAGFELVAL